MEWTMECRVGLVGQMDIQGAQDVRAARQHRIPLQWVTRNVEWTCLCPFPGF